jgi:hypothetical protein
VVNASVSSCVGGDAGGVALDSVRQIYVFLAWFASAGLHGSHSAQIERQAHELELGLCLL